MTTSGCRDAAIASVACLVLLLTVAHAHLRDAVFPVYELPTSQLPDVLDGTLADWEALEPSVRHEEFIARHLGTSGTHVPAPRDEVEMAVYLAWHHATQRVFVAVRRSDALHLERVPELIAATSDVQGGGVWSYDHVGVYIDGDHTGGPFMVSHFQPTGTVAEGIKDTNNVRAQNYLLVAEATGPRTITAQSYFPTWALAPPCADGSGFRQDGLPSRSGYELYLTPWDELRPDPADSRQTVLAPGGVIGFEVDVYDYDDAFDWEAWLAAMAVGPPFPEPDFGYYNVAGMHIPNADYFVDGLLVPCEVEDCSSSPPSAVRADSWGRIKAGLAR